MSATVLVCDDELMLRTLVRAALGRSYEVFEARDGEEGIAMTRRHRPDVVVLDMIMPGRSGLDFLGDLRADPELSGTRVVMLTARTQKIDREAAMGAGADRFLPKPFSPSALSAIVEEVLADTR